jgi:cell division transport system ATP-binding protein
VLIASHDLSLIARLPYRMMTIRQGQMVAGIGKGRGDAHV